ncbi:MAG: hypothetical protein ACLQDM_14810 [Bradyrhizobium sp.]
MKAGAAPRLSLICQSVSRLMKGSCLPSIAWSAVGRKIRIPLLPDRLIPGNNGIEPGRLRLRPLPAECEMNADGLPSWQSASVWVLESFPNRCLQPAKPDIRISEITP